MDLRLFPSSFPCTFMLPLVLSTRPVRREIMVVFPAPLWPRRQKMFLLYKERLTPFTAFVAPYSLYRPLIWMVLLLFLNYKFIFLCIFVWFL